jgi:2-methylcitrate dehydratase PrpD
VTAAERIARFASGLRFEDIPADVVERLKLHVLDVLGCAFAARAAGVGAEAGAWVADTTSQDGPAVLLGTGAGASAADAALANGMLCHALDFDDTHPVAISHVSAVVVPAALAVAQARGAGGRGLLTAIAVGGETVMRLGMTRPGAFHARGLHPTSACGVFGATAAVATVSGLDERQIVSALGIAGSTASGLFEYLADGTMTKPFHAGWAAHAGVVAAGLAGRGVTGPATVIEGRYGVFRALLGEDVSAIVGDQMADLGQRWEWLAMAIKLYPACHYTHAAMDGVRRLRERGIGAEDVVALQLDVPEGAVGLVLEPADRKRHPATAYEAKFSLPFSAAAMLCHGDVDLASYAQERLAEQRVLDLAARTEYTVVEPDGRGPFFTIVRARLADGATEVVDVPYPSGSPETPLSREQVADKFLANAEPWLGAGGARDAVEAILVLDEVEDLRALRFLSATTTKEPGSGLLAS